MGQVKAECDHGLVVSGLVRLLESEGHEVANRRPFDLFIYDEEGINSLFEIKTDSTTTACYTAIGQLLVYSAGMQKKPSLFAVFPERLDERIRPAFAEIGIQLVLYNWDRDKLVFDNFPP